MSRWRRRMYQMDRRRKLQREAAAQVERDRRTVITNYAPCIVCGVDVPVPPATTLDAIEAQHTTTRCPEHGGPVPTTSGWDLWDQARREHPHDPDARRRRYVELMRKHGLVVPREPGDDGNLPCGWPGRVASPTDHHHEEPPT